jgi:hypothetical protein
MTGPTPSDPAPSNPGGLVEQPISLTGIFPETLRFVYLVFLPVAGGAAMKMGGGSVGRGWGLGIGIGLFLYHYLLWALHETDRIVWRFQKPAGGWPRWSWLLSPLLVFGMVKGEWSTWLIEQTLLEAGAFVVAVGILAMRKCADEGKEAPWFLAIAVFVLPAAALLVKLGSVWLSRREGSPGWSDLAFAVAMGFSLTGHYRRLWPFINGEDQLVEPLSTSTRMVGMVLWFLVLLVGGIVVGG